MYRPSNTIDRCPNAPGKILYIRNRKRLDPVKQTGQTLLTRVRRVADQPARAEFDDLYRPLVTQYALDCGLSDNDAARTADECIVAMTAFVTGPTYDARAKTLKYAMWTTARQLLQRYTPDNSRPTGSCTTPAPATPGPDAKFERIWYDAHRNHCLDQLRIETSHAQFDAYYRIAVDRWPIERVCANYSLTHEQAAALYSRLNARMHRLMMNLVGSPTP